MITIILYVVLGMCAIGTFWGLYIMFLHWLTYHTWVSAMREPLQNLPERPVWSVEDAFGREIARFD